MAQDKTIRSIGYKEFKDIEEELQLVKGIEEAEYLNTLSIINTIETEDEESDWVAKEMQWKECDEEVPLDILLDEDRKQNEYNRFVEYEKNFNPEDLRLLSD